MSSAKTYTASDIQRYHNGGMTPAEMHSLEKASLEDPMLADALEGYTNTTTPSADLQNLQSRLQQRIEEDRKTKRPFLNSQWVKVAALFIVIAGGGWLVLQLFTERNDNIATLERKSTATEETTAAASVPGAATVQDSATLDNATTTAATSAPQAPPPAATSSAPATTTTDAATNEIASNKKGHETVVINEAKPGEVAMAPAAGIATIKDNTSVRASSAATDTINNSDMALQTEAAPSTDVSANMKKVQARERKQIAVLPEPVGGFVMFEKYIAANRKAPTDFKLSKGDVVLSFDIDKNGRPVNITVTKSLCEACDADAVRLVKVGPSWRANGTKGSVTITF